MFKISNNRKCGFKKLEKFFLIHFFNLNFKLSLDQEVFNQITKYFLPYIYY